VNTEIFKPVDKSKVRKKLGIPKEKNVIIYVGRVSQMKGGVVLSKLIKSNPSILFLVVGKWIDKEIPLFKSKNLKVIEKVPNKELPIYYSASDLTFAYSLQGDQFQIVGEESLACGTSVIHTKRVHKKREEFIIKIDCNIAEANKKIRNYLKINSKKRKSISKKACDYAIRNFSDEMWKKRYLEFYLS